MTIAGEVAMSSTGTPLNAQDANFESFIDSDQIMETTSSAPPTPKGKANLGEAQKHKQLSLSALPTRLNEVKQSAGGQEVPDSPTVSDYLHFPRDASSSDVTTPTTASNSSSLHNLNFDFFEGDHSAASTNSSAGASNLTSSSTGQMSAVFDDHSMQTTPTEVTRSSVPSADVFNWSASSAFFPIPMAHSLTRSSDDADCGMDSRYLSQNNQHHHQRSLSLREVAPPSISDGYLASSLTSLPFPSVKLESQEADLSGPYTSENMPSPMTEDRSSPASSSAICSSLFEMASPRQEKKRRLASPSESVTSVASSKNAKHSHAGSTGNTRRASGGSNRKRKSSTSVVKGSTSNSAPNDLGSSISLIENISKSSSLQGSPNATSSVSEGTSLTSKNIEGNGEKAEVESKEGLEASKADNTSTMASDAITAAIAPAKTSNKRPPPSASQITESGQPFPVIDTSAKHSSLFIPPDTSGLTKREARLVKNRAAAFLSRQRKREQFEELEIKCKSLCRLVWRFWEIVAGPNHDIPFAEKFNQTKILPIVLGEELEDVKEVLEMVVALKGGSVAPTEDGQVQGAIAAGIKSADGKIFGSALTAAATKVTTSSSSSSSTVNAAHDGELARLRSQLEESKKREASLQAELNRERGLRLGHDHNKSYHEEQGIRPFKGGKAGGAISLTIPPAFEDEMEEDDQYRIGSTTTSRRKSNRSRITPSRTSERILRQHSSNLALTPINSAANGGQRKAAGAALMMVLFSFALFGLPSGQTPRIGGITQVGSAEDFSVGKVLGAPLSTAQYGQDEEEENGDFDMKQAPSSHLSAKDLLPSAIDSSDFFNLDEMHATVSTPRLERMQHSFQEVLRSGSNGASGNDDESIVDYRAFARDLGASLDWDVERGFLVIGSDHEQENEGGDAKGGNRADAGKDGIEEKSDEAPTKLTLFVPAPDVTTDLDTMEDRFYDAPLATADVSAGGEASEGGTDDKRKSGSTTPREMTQAEATKAALRVLRNHRVAQEAAALATTRRLGKKPVPSQQVDGSSQIKRRASLGHQHTFVPPGKSGSLADVEREQQDDRMDIEEDDQQDFSKEVMGDASSTTDKIRGTDFYQLEFSLSGAKVRNVAELAKLFGVVRSKRV